VTTIDLWQYTIERRGNHDDLTIDIPCCECGENCGGNTQKVPLHWAVVKYVNTEPKYICEACTNKAGAEFIWNIAKAVDDVDFLFYGVEDSEQLRRIADLTDHVIGDITESWRRMAANDL
jgi:RecJ-like exonuclease